MDPIKQGSLKWLDDLAALTVQVEKTPEASKSELARTLNLHRQVVINLLILSPILDPETVEKIRQAALSDPPYILSYNSAKALTGLKGKVPDLPRAVQEALDLILPRRLATKQIGALVEWMVSGKPVGDFDPSKVKKRSKVRSPKSTGKETSSQETQSPKPEIATSATAPIGAPPRNDSKVKQSKTPVMGTAESLFWGQLAGVSLVSRIRAKIKKGERPTLGESLILVGAMLLGVLKFLGHWAWKALHWVGKKVFRLFYRAVKGLAGLLGGVVGGILEKVLVVVLFVLLCWGAYEFFFQHRSVGGLVKEVVMWPIEKIESRFSPPRRQDRQEGFPGGTQPETIKPVEPPKTTTEISPLRRQARQEGLKPVLEKQKVLEPTTSKPASLGAQPWKAEEESREYLEAEIAAIPLPARIKMVTFQVDIMSADMSVKRLGDLQDPERYSLIVGHDKHKVLSVSPAMTGFTLTYGDGLPIGGILGGPSKIEFYWEDVKAIHCDEIKTKTNKRYQFGLVVNAMKKPFIVQCATADDLRHLVSAFEFWIKAATKTAEVPLSGMPYLSQGLRLENSGKVALLWADSPVDQAAIELGDGIWSLDGNPQLPQGKTDLEAALDSLTPGKHYIYVATSEDWGNGPKVRYGRNDRPFNPKRQKMELLVP